MTVVRVISEPGRLDDASRAKLAESLTSAVLDVEVGSDNPAARRGIMVLFHEQPAERWAVGGRFDDTHVAGAGR
ncbi:MAG: tautomerase family protein, partial [Chloroflexi bacterium]|nr:tautomerase family protein [Chloroflexota bacterium]